MAHRASGSFASETNVILRLILFSAYALTLLTVNVMHFEREPTAGLLALAVVLWSVLLVDYIRQLRAAPDRRTFVRVSIGYPIYLLTLPFAAAHNPWLIAVPLIVGFVLQLRHLAAGRAATFALALFAFIAVIATAGVVYAEQDEPTSKLKDWPEAATWAIAQLIHLRGYRAGYPQSPDGITLSFVLAISGLIVAALLTAQLVAWVIGTERAPAATAPDESVANTGSEAKG